MPGWYAIVRWLGAAICFDRGPAFAVPTTTVAAATTATARNAHSFFFMLDTCTSLPPCRLGFHAPAHHSPPLEQREDHVERDADHGDRHESGEHVGVLQVEPGVIEVEPEPGLAAGRPEDE